MGGVGGCIELEFELKIKLGEETVTFITGGGVPLTILGVSWTMNALKTLWQRGEAPKGITLQWDDPSSHMATMVYTAVPRAPGDGLAVAKQALQHDEGHEKRRDTRIGGVKPSNAEQTVGATDTGEGPDAAGAPLDNHFEGSTDGRREPATGQTDLTEKPRDSAEGVQADQAKTAAQPEAGAQGRVTTQIAQARMLESPTDNAVKQ